MKTLIGIGLTVTYISMAIGHFVIIRGIVAAYRGEKS